jgi:hypothetical protein
MVVSSYLIFYMTERMEITVMVMGSIMVAARVLDMIMGFVSGVVVQKLHLKLGQFRTWLLIGPISGVCGAGRFRRCGSDTLHHCDVGLYRSPGAYQRLRCEPVP